MIKKVSWDEIKSLKGKTKKEDLALIGEVEIQKAVINDPDTVIPTKKELKTFTQPKERKPG